MDALNTVKPSQGTMLHIAAKLGNADVVRALLVSEVDASIRDESGATAFEVADTEQVRLVFYDVLLQLIGQSKVNHVEKLLSCGVDVNYQSSSTGGNSILHWGAIYGNKDMLKVLLDAKCNVNAVNNDGVTALHEAVVRNDAKLVEELLVRGADPNIEATSGKSAGKSPKALAESNPEILALIEKASKLPLGQTKDNSVLTIDDQTPSELSSGDTEDITENSATEVSSPSPVQNHNTAAPELQVPEPEPALVDPRLRLLWPKPQQMTTQNEGTDLKLPQEFTIKVLPSPSGVHLEKQVDIWTIQSAMLQDLGFKPALESGLEGKDALVVCLINQQLFQKKESYRIVVNESQVQMICSDISGLWYASCTFLNLVRLCGKDGLPQLKISDWPSLAHRAVMLDMSSGRIQTIDYLLFQVNTLSLLKFNELHFYIKVAKDSKLETLIPYLPSELLDMEVYCNYRFMNVVPHIDSFADVQLTPDTFRLYRQVLSLFSNNRSVNIGPNLSRKLLSENVTLNTEGETPTEWPMSLEDKLRLMGVKQEDTVMFCSNEMDATSQIQFPLGSIGVHYGTRDWIHRLPRNSDMEQHWGSPETTIKNILNATKCCRTNGDAVGMLMVKWAGRTFLDHCSLAWPGIVTASGCSWNTAIDESHIHNHLAQVINYLIYQDAECTLGDVILEMGKACTLLNRTFCNAGASSEASDSVQPMDGGSFLCQLLYKPDDTDLTHMTSEVAQKVMLRMRKCQSSLKKGSKVPLNATAVLELYLVSDLILWAAKVTRSLVIAGSKPKDGSDVGVKVVNAGIANLTATTKTDCANKLLSLMEEYRNVWLKTCHPSGLLESLSFFGCILDKLVPQQTT
ncbi:hypothetical protein BSL78_10986 [Apostichopus japonicus]|uniref:Beta-hexosaminidase bacterial type N-terminal domain-containing protein n=1 Tax=Stichopus japonicus TaxID=307972 RepID=A0A2G8KVW0_STIJA|nr:hypothetical protein BSL78_10986 [Apostichopus japonicus]